MNVNDKLKSIWMDMVMAYFKVLSQYFPGGSMENYRKFQSVQLDS